MTPGQQADLQLRLVEVTFRQRSPEMDQATLERLRLRSEALLHRILFVPGADPEFDGRLDGLRQELRTAL
jgi:hypothetical protein